MFSRVDLSFQKVISVLKTDLIACARDLKSCRTSRSLMRQIYKLFLSLAHETKLMDAKEPG